MPNKSTIRRYAVTLDLTASQRKAVEAIVGPLMQPVAFDELGRAIQFAPHRGVPIFDKNHDQAAICARRACGHPYERHFDWNDDYRPGCKYCACREFVEPNKAK